jgi:hypothetical protein
LPSLAIARAVVLLAQDQWAAAVRQYVEDEHQARPWDGEAVLDRVADAVDLLIRADGRAGALPEGRRRRGQEDREYKQHPEYDEVAWMIDDRSR